jgi:hypothetical protein
MTLATPNRVARPPSKSTSKRFTHGQRVLGSGSPCLALSMMLCKGEVDVTLTCEDLLREDDPETNVREEPVL